MIYPIIRDSKSIVMHFVLARKKNLISFLVQFYCLNQFQCLGIYFIYNSLDHENPL